MKLTELYLHNFQFTIFRYFSDSEQEEDESDIDDYDDGVLDNMAIGPGQASGCTAVVALLVGRELFVANAGDSRCVLCRNGKAVGMSIDQKPEDKEESLRILKAGGRVTKNGRVNDGLNVSRAIGDHTYKTNKDLRPEEQMITAMPVVKTVTLQDDDEFIVLACDGIWNCMSSEEVVAFVRARLTDKKEKISSIMEEVCCQQICMDIVKVFKQRRLARMYQKCNIEVNWCAQSSHYSRYLLRLLTWIISLISTLVKL